MKSLSCPSPPSLLFLWCCLCAVIYGGIILLVPSFHFGLTKWMKQLSSLSAGAVEMGALTLSAGGRPWRWIKPNAEMRARNCGFQSRTLPFSSSPRPTPPTSLRDGRWMVYPNMHCKPYIIVARSNFRRKQSRELLGEGRWEFFMPARSLFLWLDVCTCAVGVQKVTGACISSEPNETHT